MTSDSIAQQGKPDMLQAALEYLPLKIFPVKADKTPLTEHGLKDATQTQLGVKEYWTRYPDAGIAIVTDGLVVLDFDVKSGGLDSKEKIIAKYGPLPRTRTHRTGGGGEHWIYRNPNGFDVRNKVQLGGYPGVDIRANGGYIVAPPSPHTSGNRYEVIDDSPIAYAPEWLITLTESKPEERRQAEPIGETIENHTRNTTLTSLAGSMRRRGLSPDVIYNALLEVNRQQCNPPLEEAAIRRIADSIGRYPPGPAAPAITGKNAENILTDSTNAEFIARLYGEGLRYDHMRGRWLLKKTHYWQPDNNGEVYRMAQRAARERYKTAADIPDLKERQRVASWAIGSEQRSRIESAIALLQNVEGIADNGKNWDSDPWLFAVSNGVIDLRTGLLRSGTSANRITLHSEVVYDPAATCPRWMQFLDEVFSGDRELIDYIQRAAGYSMTGDTTEQCLFIAYGTGANGKGKFTGTLRHVIGEYAYDAPFSTFELINRAAIPNDLAALERRRFVTSSETNDGTRLNEARIKALTGGDPCTARYLHQEFFTFEPMAKYWLAVNHKPTVRDDSIGFWRRVRLIPFIRQFRGADDDKHLPDKLKAEASGILNWLIAGCLEWQKKGLDPVPAAIQQSTTDYQAESDPLSQFIAECCTEYPAAITPASELYNAYTKWANNAGLLDREKLTRTRFGRMVGDRYQKTRTLSGNLYKGIGLNVGFHVGLQSQNHELQCFSPTVELTRENIENYTQPYIPYIKQPDYPTGPCKKCGSPDYDLNEANQWVCPNGHIWEGSHG